MFTQRIIVEENEQNQRIDKFLSVKLNNFTRSQVQRWCDNSYVKVNSAVVAKSYSTTVGDVIDISVPEENEQILPENLNLEILYDDDFLAIVNKPKGMLVHPTPHQKEHTLSAGLLYKYGDNISYFGGDHRPGIVHRLDKDTSGLLVVAKNEQVHKMLNTMIQNREIYRGYKAVVYGVPIKSEGRIEAPIARDQAVPVKMAVVKGGRNATTLYKILEVYESYSLVELKLLTGRTHQIRVHMEHIGNPIVGDPLYGSQKVISSLKGQCLHAYKIEFIHPITKENVLVETELPDYFKDFLQSIN